MAILTQDGSLEKFIVDVCRERAKQAIDELMDSELEEWLLDGVEATEKDYRNGYYERTLKTASLGDITVRVPRERMGRFSTKLLERYQRRTANAEDLVCKLYKTGMTESEISEYLKGVYGTSLSPATVGRLAKGLLEGALGFNTRALPDCPIVYLDGTYLPLRRIYSGLVKDSYQRECVMVALGVTKSGQRVVLGFSIAPNEGACSWKDFLIQLKDRGLIDPRVFVTDGLQGMPNAISDVFPKAVQQRCLVHIQRNIAKKVRKKDRIEVADDFRTVYVAGSEEEAKERLDKFVSKWSRTYKSLADIPEIEGLLRFYSFPTPIWGILRTSNPIESLNAKLKRDTRKRISLNSLDNAAICLASSMESYNASCSKRAILGYDNMTDEQRAEMGFNQIRA